MQKKLPGLQVIDITANTSEHINLIESFCINDNNKMSITIKKVKYETSVLIDQDKIVELKTKEELNTIKLDGVDIIIYGSNEQDSYESFSLFASNRAILAEAMHLRSAIHTYNVLVQDGRNIVLLLDLNQCLF
ncbi:MAG: hypothetical protein SFT93_02445 [Rickettsiaceae bacterium]|nr:hypothetical protein [Rickettsiaceae bacterium]